MAFYLLPYRNDPATTPNLGSQEVPRLVFRLRIKLDFSYPMSAYVDDSLRPRRARTVKFD